MKRKYLTYWIFWFSLLMALVIYMVVGTISGVEETGPVDMSLTLALVVAGGIAFLAAMAIRWVMVPQLVKKSSPQAPVMFIVALALAESIGISGLVLRFIGASEAVLYTFCGVAFLTIALQIPIFPGQDPPSMRKMPGDSPQ